jgi:hypothetical protein
MKHNVNLKASFVGCYVALVGIWSLAYRDGLSVRSSYLTLEDGTESSFRNAGIQLPTNDA